MKLYYFNPNGYGEEAFVCAESKEKAIEYLLATKLPVHPQNEPGNFSYDYHQRMIKQMSECYDAYTIDEFEPGQVVFSEIC